MNAALQAVLGRFMPVYLQHHRLSARIRDCRTAVLGGDCNGNVATVITSVPVTIPAVTGTAPSASSGQRKPGSTNSNGPCCP